MRSSRFREESHRFMVFMPEIDGSVAHNASQIGKQAAGPVRRDGSPGLIIGVADTFLTVLLTGKNPERNPVERPAVFIAAFFDGSRISAPV